MKESNDFESNTMRELPVVVDVRSGTPKFPSSAIHATRCIKCQSVFFTNYPKMEYNDYECMKCRNHS